MTETPLDLTAWLAGATVTEASVDIYQRPDLLGRIEEWQRRYEAATADAPGERSAGESDPSAALEAEGQVLLDELATSKSVWYLRALSTDDEQAIEDAIPLPPRPDLFSEKPPFAQARPTDTQAKAFLKSYEAWEQRKAQHAIEHADALNEYVRAVTQASLERGAEKIVRCLARVEVDGEVVATSITHDQARALPQTIGEVQVGKIIAAISHATAQEPDLPAPFSRRASEPISD